MIGWGITSGVSAQWDWVRCHVLCQSSYLRISEVSFLETVECHWYRVWYTYRHWTMASCLMSVQCDYDRVSRLVSGTGRFNDTALKIYQHQHTSRYKYPAHER